MSTKWQKNPLAEVLRHRKQFTTIDDETIYIRPRVQLHAQGIVLRDRIPGALIKTKTQQLCRSGDFLVAEIDAKVGGYGVVPEFLNNSIVSSHYFLFEIDESKLDRRYLGYFARTQAFHDQVDAQGSTNYAAIRPAHVLTYEIPLPPVHEQQRIVAALDQMSLEIQEVYRLRRKSLEESEALTVSVHHRLASGRKRKLAEVIELVEDAASVCPTGSYPQVGVRSFGGGLFAKGAIAGIATTYKSFNRLYAGALVLSQVKGWEGAVAVCPSQLDGWYVSPEYRTFRCVPGQARPDYLASLVRTEWFWSKLANVTRGVGARRERTRPEQFLDIELVMPDVEQQIRGERLFAEISALRHLQAETKRELDLVLQSTFSNIFPTDNCVDSGRDSTLPSARSKS